MARSVEGGSWENPSTIANVINCPEVRATATSYLRLMMWSPRCMSYLGPRDWLRWRALTRIDAAWGWKDPRSTFTLPLWLDLFPEAKIVHVTRHGVDVAESLRKRHVWGCRRLGLRFKLTKPVYLFHMRREPLMPSGHCVTLDGGFALWEEYMAEARRHVHALHERAFEVKYEDVLAEPKFHLAKLASFCGEDVLDGEMDKAVAGVRRERAYAYQTDPALQAYAEKMGGKLKAYGY